MNIKLFIKNNRKEIDSIVKRYYGVEISNDRERFDWINIDEGLFRWAKQEGVNV